MEADHHRDGRVSYETCPPSGGKIIAVSLSLIPPITDSFDLEPLWPVPVLGAIGVVFAAVAEGFVWRSAPGRSVFPRVARSVEIRAEFAPEHSEPPYRGAARAPLLDAVVIDDHEFSADQIDGVRLVDWRTRELADARFGTYRSETFAALVLIVTASDGQRIPYELDVIRAADDEDAALAACTLLATLLGTKPLETIHLPLNAGLHKPSYSVAGHRTMSLLLTVGLVLAAHTGFLSSARGHVICVVAWIVLSSAIVRWHSNREMYRRNGVAFKCIVVAERSSAE